ncbi:hypothetical protein AUJ68_06825 [Candidatus Woesearchaeota archaeon CG1_02_57_44]|nr:MAG: hypothetical protein AUJ68_06825 [Candidatus Woesearchaeota archaeon CG1_02_57_44]
MVVIEITESLFEDIERTFKKGATEVFDLIGTLATSPKKGKLLGSVGGIVIKELKYRSYRFYFIADGYKLKLLRAEDLTELLLRFVRMSDKKHQQQVIDEIKAVLVNMGAQGFK